MYNLIRAERAERNLGSFLLFNGDMVGKMRYKIGDIVRFLFDSEKTAMVCGYGKGHCFSSEFPFDSEDDIVIAMRENGTVHVFKSTNPDWIVVNHVDMTDIFTHIVGAKEI